MVQDKKEKIDELIGNRDNLKSDLLYKRSLEEIKKILEMPEWKEDKFQGLLTSNI